MAVETPRGDRPNGWRRLSATEKLIAAVLAAIALVGLVLIADGLYLKTKALVSQILLQRSFALELSQGAPAKPWPWADFRPVARIEADRLGQSAIVLSGASGEALAFGPALLNGTPRPGDEGTAVIAAHRDTHFRWLKDVRPGDLIRVTRTDGVHLTFRAGPGRVAAWDRSGIDPQALGRHLALSTCYPFDTVKRGPLRYIVEAELVETVDVADGGLKSRDPRAETQVPRLGTTISLADVTSRAF